SVTKRCPAVRAVTSGRPPSERVGRELRIERLLAGRSALSLWIIQNPNADRRDGICVNDLANFSAVVSDYEVTANGIGIAVDKYFLRARAILINGIGAATGYPFFLRFLSVYDDVV